MRVYRFDWNADFLVLEKIVKTAYSISSDGYILIDKAKKDDVIEELTSEENEENSWNEHYRGCTFNVVEDKVIIKELFDKLEKSLRAEVKYTILKHATIAGELKKMACC